MGTLRAIELEEKGTSNEHGLQRSAAPRSSDAGSSVVLELGDFSKSFGQQSRPHTGQCNQEGNINSPWVLRLPVWHWSVQVCTRLRAHHLIRPLRDQNGFRGPRRLRRRRCPSSTHHRLISAKKIAHLLYRQHRALNIVSCASSPFGLHPDCVLVRPTTFPAIDTLLPPLPPPPHPVDSPNTSR